MYNIVSLAVAIVKYNIQYIYGHYGLCKIEWPWSYYIHSVYVHLLTDHNTGVYYTRSILNVTLSLCRRYSCWVQVPHTVHTEDDSPHTHPPLICSLLGHSHHDKWTWREVNKIVRWGMKEGRMRSKRKRWKRNPYNYTCLKLKGIALQVFDFGL